MGKSQNIVEAEANLEVAKAMEAINNLDVAVIEFEKITEKGYSSNSELDNALVTMKRVTEVVEKLKQFVDVFKGKKCYTEDIAFVNKVVGGIKLRSEYEEEINKLQARLKRGQHLYKELKRQNAELRQQIIKVLDKALGKELDDDVVDSVLLDIKSEYRFDRVIDKLMKTYNPEDSCNTDDGTF